MKNNVPAGNDKLKTLLEEDLGSSDAVDEYLPIIGKLQQWSTPSSAQAITDTLITQLAHELPAKQSHLERVLEIYPIAILRSQLMIVKREIWIASILLTLIGLLVTMAIYDSTSNDLTPIAILAPIIGAIGTGLIYDSGLERILELESTTRTSKQMILLARLTLVYGFNLSLSLLTSVLLSLIQSDISLLPLISSWFIPMTFLSAFAFFISIISGDAFLAWSLNIGIWTLHVVFNGQISNANPLTQYLSLQGLSTPQFHPLLLMMAMVLIGVAVWFTEQVEHGRGNVA